MTPEQLEQLLDAAHAAGMAAGLVAVPRPMVVTPVDVFNTPLGPSSVVMDGPCGFAWITIRPGNSRLAKAAKAHLGARIAYGGGMQIWVSAFNQSLARKEAYADAFVKVLRDAGFERVSTGSRMD